MRRFHATLVLAVLVSAGAAFLRPSGEARADKKPPKGTPDLLAELKSYRHKLVYETNRDGNWELYLCNADGSNPVNLTRTPDVDELYPKPGQRSASSRTRAKATPRFATSTT